MKKLICLLILLFNVCFSTETVLFLIRHGQTDWNRDKRIQGQTNIPLNEPGIAEAKALAAKIASSHSDIAAIYSSDLDRAVLTAQITSERLNLKVEKRMRLRERVFGAAEGLTLEEKQLLYGVSEDALNQLYLDYRERWNYTSIPGAETGNKLLLRVRDEFIEIATKHPNEKIAVFTHGGVIGVFISDLLGKRLLHCPNCSITQVIYCPEDLEHPFKFVAIED